MSALKHPNQHPLIVLFYTKGLTWQQGMDVLQDGPEYFISDNCVHPFEVHPDDVDAVLVRARALWAKSRLHPWQWSADARTAVDFYTTSSRPGAPGRCYPPPAPATTLT